MLDNSDGTIFDRERKTFESLAERSEELIVRHSVREVVSDLKPYFHKCVLDAIGFSISRCD